MRNLSHDMKPFSPAVAFVAPFAAFIVLIGLNSWLHPNPKWEYPLRVLIVSAILFVSLRALKSLPWRPVRPALSVVVGIFVFLLWVAPDWMSPSYRTHWLFDNTVIGTAQSSVPEAVRSDVIFLVFRLIGTAVLVPIIEELFWRGWLLRYLINADFQKVPLGSYSTLSFWATAILFATEHGPFWDVGLLAGIVYNWWILRTRSLADCVIAHSVTNACLAMFVLFNRQWQYWL